MKEFLEKIKPEEKLNNYLKDKKVILVGPSKHLLNSNLGEFIDSFDVVIRFKWHNTLPLSEWKGGKYVKDIGSKTDIIYGSTVLTSDNGVSMNKAIPYFEKGNLKHYRVPNNRDLGRFYSNDLECGTTYAEYDVGEYAKEFSRRLGIDELKVWPQVGFCGLMESIASDCKEVFVTGFTMYHGGGHIFQENKPAWHNQPIVGKHHGVLEINMLLEAISEANGRIQIDNVLYKILELHARGIHHDEISQVVEKIMKEQGKQEEKVIIT